MCNELLMEFFNLNVMIDLRVRFSYFNISEKQVQALQKRVQWVENETAYLVAKFGKKWIIF